MNTEYLDKLRQDMLTGATRPECKKCTIQEKTTRSMRNWLNDRFDHITREDCDKNFLSVQYIEMSLDNICNFQCRMCTSKFSSKLQLRDKHFGLKVSKKLEPSFRKLDNIDLSNLQEIKLLGGEPFMSPNFEPFIDYISEKSNIENIKLSISTNGSKKLDSILIEKLNRFHDVPIHVSLDSYDKSNDYQRVGGNYSEIFENSLYYSKMMKKTYVKYHTTVGIYTANHLSKTLKVFDKHNKNPEYKNYTIDFIRDPDWQSLLYAPDSFKQWIIDTNSDHKFARDNLITFMKNSKYDEDLWNELLSKTEQYDEYYDQSLKDYNPELYGKMYGE